MTREFDHSFGNQRLGTKIIKLVDVSYGGENGFNQAIELSADALSNVKFIQEKKLIGRQFHERSSLMSLFVCIQVDISKRYLRIPESIVLAWMRP